jgi:hypothetical protein
VSGRSAHPAHRRSIRDRSRSAFPLPIHRLLPQANVAPAVICAFVDAVNSGDTAAFLALFEAGGAVDDWGSRYVGRDEIRAWSDRELIGAQATLAIRSTREQGNLVSVLAEVGGNGFNGPSRFSFAMNGALAREMRISPD